MINQRIIEADLWRCFAIKSEIATTKSSSYFKATFDGSLETKKNNPTTVLIFVLKLESKQHFRRTPSAVQRKTFPCSRLQH